MNVLSLLPAALILLAAALFGPASAVWAIRQHRGKALSAAVVGSVVTALVTMVSFYWEQDVNNGPTRGWALVYILPALVLAALVYSAALTLLAICSLPGRAKKGSGGRKLR